MEYRIQEIKVEGLFGMFDHTIPLNQKEHITIVYGENGIGKTMLFRIVDALFNQKYTYLFTLPFSALKISFNQDCYLELIKENEKIKFVYQSQDGNVGRFNPLSETSISASRKDITDYVVKNYPEYTLHPDGYILDEEVNHAYKFDDFVKSHPYILAPAEIWFPDDLENLLNGVKIKFVGTQRLLTAADYRVINHPHNSKSYHLNKGIWGEAVIYYSNLISFLIEQKYKDYIKLSEKLESSLGKRLLDNQVKTDYTYDELVKEAEIVNERRAELKSVGLLNGQSNDDFVLDKEMDDISKAVISVNVQDIKSKLKIFDDFYTKLKLFTEILNERRLSYKKISISREKGFTFINENGQELTLDKLSSGEQHELILMYELLFLIPENALIMIDEPEISLHIAWQKEFLQDMQDIIKLRNFDIVLATHSPSIVNGNWSMTVALTGKELVEQ